LLADKTLKKLVENGDTASRLFKYVVNTIVF